MRRPLTFALVLSLVVGALVAAPAHADHATAPNVIGKDVDRAVHDIERAGLEAVVVEIADAPEGRVAAQDPAAGTALERGSPVQIHVGVMIRIETRVPSVVGWEADRALRALSGAYVVEVEEVRVDGARDGTVIETVPAAGSRHPFRGVLILRVAVVPQRIPVPAVQGLSFEQAERVLVGLGLVVQPTFVPAYGVPPWSVVSQLPAANTLVELGSEVQIAVAQPRRRGETVRVPNLFGMSEREVARVLGSMGLVAEIARIPSSFPEGRVFQQNPAAGSNVRAGTPVQVSVSARGGGPGGPGGGPGGGGMVGGRPRFVPVPDLAGLALADARIALATAGFQAQIDFADVPNQPVDRVLSQEPGAGMALPPGSRVLVRAATPTTVPDVVGRRQDEAAALLVAAGLQAILESPASDPRAVVATQGPEAGTQISRGSTIRLVVAVNPGTRRIAVPSVVGFSGAEAHAALAGIGLNVAFDGPPLPPTMTEVVSQDPPGGAQVPRGTMVRLRVARRR